MAKAKKETQHFIIDLDNLLIERHQQRDALQMSGEILRLKDQRERQKAWNYKRGALVRKYKKIIADPTSSKVSKKLAEKEINSLPLYKLSLIDNEIKRIMNEDYVITVTWKSGNFQLLSSEILSLPSASLYVLRKIKESYEQENWGANEDFRERKIAVIDYNIESIERGTYEEQNDRNKYPIYFEFVGDYIVIDV